MKKDVVMKSTSIFSLYCYLMIVTFFLDSKPLKGSFFRIDSLFEESCLDDLSGAINCEESIARLICKVRIIQKKYQSPDDDDLSNKNDDSILEDEENLDLDIVDECQDDILIEIMAILLGMYEKIVGATVTYLVMSHTPMQENLHVMIAKIISDDALRIFNIIGKKYIEFVLNKKISLQDKIIYCMSLACCIVFIKMGLYFLLPCDQNQNVPNNQNPFIFNNLPGYWRFFH